MTTEMATPVHLSTFAREVLASGEMWTIVDAYGWQDRSGRHDTKKPLMGLWTTRREAAFELPQGPAFAVKRLSLAEFLYEIAEDTESGPHAVALNWSGDGRGLRATSTHVANALRMYAAKLKQPLPACAPLIHTVTATGTSEGITFDVDEVTPAQKAREEEKMHAAFKRRSRSGLESCSDYHSDVLADVEFHPFFAAVHLAYSEHRPLVLSPDAVWLTIAQGVSHHIQNNAEALREKFVSHAGKKKLEVTCRGFLKGSPENPWGVVIDQFSAQIRERTTAGTHALFVNDFSTTGPVERIASEVVLMEAMQHYFDYVCMCVCGIPRITLQGSPGDWEKIQRRVQALEELGLGWWVEHLRPVCAEFVNAARGQINLRHWRRIYKLLPAYGTQNFNGWICSLIPYVGREGVPNKRNPYFEDKALSVNDLPCGLAVAPFIFRDGEKRQDWPMDFVAGFCGVEQDRATLALKPKIGWGVRDGDRFEQLFTQMESAHEVNPPWETEWEYWQSCASMTGVPGDLKRFQKRCDGVSLFEGLATLYGRLKIKCLRTYANCPPDNAPKITPLDPEPPGLGNSIYLIKVGETADGGVFAIHAGDVEAWPVLYFKAGGTQNTVDCPIVAESLVELIAVLLAHGDRPFEPAVACKTLHEMWYGRETKA